MGCLGLLWGSGPPLGDPPIGCSTRENWSKLSFSGPSAPREERETGKELGAGPGTSWENGGISVQEGLEGKGETERVGWKIMGVPV